MSGWVLPGAAAAFWAGLAGAAVVGERLPVWLWLAGGAAALGVALAAVPTGARDPLSRLVHAEASAIRAVSPARLTAGRGPPVARAILVIGGLALFGVGWGELHTHRVEDSLLVRLAPQTVTVVGSLRVDPSPKVYGWSAPVDVAEVRWEGGAAALRGMVWARGSHEMPDAVRGDRVRLTGQILLPDDEGFAQWLLRRGLSAELRVDRAQRLGPSSDPVIRAAQAFRGLIGRSISSLFPEEEAGLLLGLALGDDSRLDEGLTRDFRATGLSHLLVVSGQNVAMVLAPVMGLALVLRLGATARFLWGISTVVFFVVLTGAEPSVMRAGVMAGLALIGVLLGRARSTASILAGAVLLLLVVDPALVWSIGFQLSVAATAGMVGLAAPLADRLGFLPRPVALAAGATVAAQMGVTPLLLFHFREVPLSTLVANLLAFPAVSPALLLGLAAAATGVVLPPLGAAVAAVALVPMRYLRFVASNLAGAPIPWVTSQGGAAPLVVGGIVLLCLTWWLRSGRRMPRTAVAAAAALVPLFVWTSAITAGPPSGLVVRFFDVGQGDAALVSSPSGATVLVDGGPDPGAVATKLSALGVKRLDVVVASHPHADHLAGLPAVLARFPVGLVLEPGCGETTPAHEDLGGMIEEESVTVREPRAGDVFVVGDLLLEVLAPDRCSSGTDSDANNDSLVIRVARGTDTVLFPGDAEEPSQQSLLDSGTSLEADVLKVPHHGGATSLDAFFHAVSADLAIVSVGQNEYGHPVPEVLSTIVATGAEILRTDHLGDVVVTFSPEGLLVASAS